MPAITSLTSVCAPKPIATPTTPAPAISGPISTPSEDSTISSPMITIAANSMFWKIGSSVRTRACRGSCCPCAAAAGPSISPSRRAMTALMMLQPKSAARMMTAALMPPRRMRLVMLSLGRHRR